MLWEWEHSWYSSSLRSFLDQELWCLTEIQQTAKIQKCNTIIVVDKIKSRLRTARSLGATHTIHTNSLSPTALNEAVLAFVPGGVSIVIDTTGAPALLEESLKCLRKLGKLVLIGVPPLEYELKVNLTEHLNVSINASSLLSPILHIRIPVH